MKYYIFIVLGTILLSGSTNAKAQEKGKFSYLLDASYIYYSLNSSRYSVKYQNSFNYEISTRLFYNVSNSFSIGFGLGYQNKDYFYMYDQPDFNEILKKQYHQKNLNFYFPISYRRIKIKNIGLYINNAIVLNYILDFKAEKHSIDGSDKVADDIGFYKRTGTTYRFSIDIVKPLNEKIRVFISPFWNYKYQFERLSYWDNNRFNLDTSDISYGVSIGVFFN